MNEFDRNALSVMKNIIMDYLDKKISNEEAAARLISIDSDKAISISSLRLVTDCYYAIKHLTETEFKTTDFELTYLIDCINGVREYDYVEKKKLIQEYYGRAEDPVDVMKIIIDDYLDGKYSRKKTVERLAYFFDTNLIYSGNPEPMVVSCYYTIKHLTETGYETTDFEMAYFQDCLNGVRKYDSDELNELMREYFKNQL